MQEKKKYKVVRFRFERSDGGEIVRHMIIEDLLPVLEINQFIEAKSIRAVSTGKEYAKKLVVYLNWLDSYDITYDVANNSHVKKFVDTLVYGDLTDLKIRSLESSLSYSTLNSYVTVVTEFYKWLDNNYETNMRFFKKKNTQRARQSYLYGQIYEYDYKYIIDRYLPRLKLSKEYIKWYTEEDKSLICSGFNTVRDECIFRLTLEGFRIDEVLSMTVDNYDALEGLIQPSRSKGKQTVIEGNKSHLRIVALPKRTVDLIDKYLCTERIIAENESMNISNDIFINLNSGKYQGEALKYRNYLKILKRCCEKVGFNSKKIRTHSGRSTKVMELLEYQATHPDSGLTDVHVLETMGWRSPESIEHYRNHNNEIIARSVMQKLHKEDQLND
ncbi:MAG TPA: site-specific integrase [Clostridia bacterium]|nr:site-specific integrase [Clostridia bacterium]